jgi:2-methylaconitate cis-trans-isomerase PrpF
MGGGASGTSEVVILAKSSSPDCDVDYLFGAIALAVAAVIRAPSSIARSLDTTAPSLTRMGHPSGALVVGAEASQQNGEWIVTKAIMSRSARRLMEGWVRIPNDITEPPSWPIHRPQSKAWKGFQPGSPFPHIRPNRHDGRCKASRKVTPGACQ